MKKIKSKSFNGFKGKSLFIFLSFITASCTTLGPLTSQSQSQSTNTTSTSQETNVPSKEELSHLTWIQHLQELVEAQKELGASFINIKKMDLTDLPSTHPPAPFVDEIIKSKDLIKTFYLHFSHLGPKAQNHFLEADKSLNVKERIDQIDQMPSDGNTNANKKNQNPKNSLSPLELAHKKISDEQRKNLKIRRQFRLVMLTLKDSLVSSLSTHKKLRQFWKAEENTENPINDTIDMTEKSPPAKTNDFETKSLGVFKVEKEILELKNKLEKSSQITEKFLKEI
jgi:hypothetical protein